MAHRLVMATRAAKVKAMEYEPKILWLAGFVGIYWLYCLYWGARGFFSSRTAADYFIAGRNLPFWVFALSATATSFAGWTFLGHPGQIYKDGFQYAYASFYAIAIPFAGVLFLKRQWLIGKRFGFVTPGEMFAEYFQGQFIRFLVVAVALCFSIPYLAIQLRASGMLFNVLTEDLVSTNEAMVAFTAVLALYVLLGGMRSVAHVGALQCLLMAVGIVGVGSITYVYAGGYEALRDGIAAMAELDDQRVPEKWGAHSHYVAIPGVIQWVDHAPMATGGIWTGVMILTFMLALMGIQSSPTFTMWAFSSRSTAPFATQQVWVSSFLIGLILLVFAAVQGIGGHLLGADVRMNGEYPELVNNVLGPMLDERGADDLLKVEGKQELLVPMLINIVADIAPYLVGFLALCALAAMQSTAAAYLTTASGIVTRDVIKRYLLPDASYMTQRFVGRVFVLIIAAGALGVAMFTTETMVLLGGLATSFGFQMWPALIAICFVPWLTRAGVTCGLFLGIIGVIATEPIGTELAAMIGVPLPWGRWPLTMHSAFWGMALNITAAVVISAISQTREGYAHRLAVHSFVREFAAVPSRKRWLIPIAWIFVLVWFFFAIGPGAVIGNTIFGQPENAGTWVFGIPSIWAWQLIWWFLGVLLMGFLAYRLQMSSLPNREFDPLIEDIGDLDRSSSTAA